MKQSLVAADLHSDSSPTSIPSPALAPWSAVAAIGVGAFALVTAEFLPVGLLPQIANDLAISERQASIPTGMLLGGLFGWRMAMGAFAALASLVVIVLVLLLPLIGPEKSSGFAQIPAVLRLPKVQVGLVAVILIFTGQFAAYTYITPYLNQISGIESSELSLLLLGYGVAGIFGNLFCGWCVERDGRLAVLGTSLLLGSAMLLLGAMGDDPLPAIAAVVTWGFGFGMLPIAIQSWIFRAAPDRLESVAALLGGLAVDHYGVASAVWLGAVGALGGAI